MTWDIKEHIVEEVSSDLVRIIHILLRSSHFYPKAMGRQYRIVV